MQPVWIQILVHDATSIMRGMSHGHKTMKEIPTASVDTDCSTQCMGCHTAVICNLSSSSLAAELQFMQNVHESCFAREQTEQNRTIC